MRGACSDPVPPTKLEIFIGSAEYLTILRNIYIYVKGKKFTMDAKNQSELPHAAIRIHIVIGRVKSNGIKNFRHL